MSRDGERDPLDRVRRFVREETEPEEGEEPLGERFAEIAVHKGYITPEAMEACLQEQDRGQETPIPVGQILLKRGHLSVQQFLDVMREQKKVMLACPRCKAVYQIQGGHAEGRAVCLKCQEDLVSPDTSQVLRGPSYPETPYGWEPEGQGLSIGKYRLVREIARGGMGVVYEAEDPDLRRRIAVKVIRTRKGDREEVRRLRREAALAARLAHPGIIDIHEVGSVGQEEATVHYIAMEYIEGSTLAERIPRLSLEEKIRILCGVADAVGYAHDHGVVHRDLKPGNILLRKDGRPVVTDFGLARGEDDRSKLTLSGALLGTPQYMAPEQVGGKIGEIDARTDVWALGVILYEMMTRRTPFAGKSSADLYLNILNREPVPPRRIQSGLSPDLETICLAALEKDRSRRFADAGAFARDLERAQKGDPISARPPSVLYRTGKWMRRHRIWIGAAAAVLVLSAGGWWGANYRQGHTAFTKAREEAKRADRAGDWAVALSRSEQALDWKFDPELRSIALRCRRELAAAETRRAERDRQLTVQATLSFVSDKLHEVRDSLRISKAPISRKMADLEKALEEVEALSRDPNHAKNVEVWRLLGSGWFYLGDMDRAEGALRKAFKLNPADGWVVLHLGQVHLDRATQEMFHPLAVSPRDAERRAVRWIEEARRFLGRRVRGWEGHVATYAWLANVYEAWARGRRREVERLCMAAMKEYGRGSGVEEFMFLMGWMYVQHQTERHPGDPGSGHEGHQHMGPSNPLDMALMFRPHYAWALFFRGLMRLKRNRLDQAIEDFDRAVAARPYFAIAYTNRGSAWYMKGDYDRAVQDCTRALRQSPKVSPALHFRGCAYRKKGDLKRALEDAEAALRMEPRVPMYLAGRGLVRKEMKEYRAAAADLALALDLAPADWNMRKRVQEELRLVRAKAGSE